MKKEVRAVWIPFMDFSALLTGKSKDFFCAEFSRRLELAASHKINTIYVHVRPFGDALYPSEYFPASYLISGTEGEKMCFDPLECMVNIAHNYGIEIEAWINPFRIRAGHLNVGNLCSTNPAVEFLASGDAISYNNGITYNPASLKAWELVVNGLREICRNYDVDGIHFDDYFYPTADPAFDLCSFNSYKLPGGGLSLKAWRKQNISLFLKQCYSATHEYHKRFGISPKGFMECNLEEEFLDVPQILSKSGYVDYICPQAYFAISDEICSFENVVTEYDRLIKTDEISLISGLAVYKIGHPDIHAGVGSEEWLSGNNLLSQMVSISRKAAHHRGYSLYNYQSSFLPESKLERRIANELTALEELIGV